MSSVPTSAFLALALILFCIGLYGALTKRNTVIVLISIELMLNAVNINLVPLVNWEWHHRLPGKSLPCSHGVAAAEAAVGLAILMAFTVIVKPSISTK